MSSTWFITGVSRGMGRELTEQALARTDARESDQGCRRHDRGGAV